MKFISFFQVFNVVPSISAVTGISPGRYLWRMVIAFHLGPRLLIVSTYYHFLLTFLEGPSRMMMGFILISKASILCL